MNAEICAIVVWCIVTVLEHESTPKLYRNPLKTGFLRDYNIMNSRFSRRLCMLYVFFVLSER